MGLLVRFGIREKTIHHGDTEARRSHLIFFPRDPVYPWWKVPAMFHVEHLGG
jgi:hypothetical protein